jgi:hypothetical protein
MLATLFDRGLRPATAFSMHLILFNYFRGFATSLEMEAVAEADTGVTADEWMNVQKPALEAVLADQDLPAFRGSWTHLGQMDMTWTSTSSLRLG